MANCEQLVTPQRILDLVEPFGLGIDGTDIPELKWWDRDRDDWDSKAYDEVTDKIFDEQYDAFLEAAEAATPGRKDSQRRIWKAESPLGAFFIMAYRNRKIGEEEDELATFLRGPDYGLRIEGPAQLKPVEGLETAGATQSVGFSSSQDRWDSHPKDSGRSLGAQYDFSLPLPPRNWKVYEERESDEEGSTKPLLTIYSSPTKLKFEDTIRGSDGLLTSFDLGVKVLQSLDAADSEILTK
jgi:hypothetical protein